MHFSGAKQHLGIISLNLFTTCSQLPDPQRFPKLRGEHAIADTLVPLWAPDLLVPATTSYHSGLLPGGFYLLMDALNRFEVFDSFYAKF